MICPVQVLEHKHQRTFLGDRLGRAHSYLHNVYWNQLGRLIIRFEEGSWDALLAEAEDLVSWSRSQGAELLAACGMLLKAGSASGVERQRERRRTSSCPSSER